MELGKQLIYLTESEVKKCITVKEAVQLAEKAGVADGEGKVVGDKFYMNIGENGFVKPFSGYVDGEDYAYIKTFTMFPENASKDLPRTVSNVMLLDAKTGLTVCFMEGTWVTGLKTGSSTAAVVKNLAKKDSKVLAIFGAGTQGRSHIEAINEVMDIDEVRIFNRTHEKAVQFAEEMGAKLGLKIVPTTTKQETVEGADVVVTVTTGSDTLVEKEWLKPGALVCRMGSFQEINPEVILGADKFIVDRWKYVSPRAPEIKQLVEEGKISEDSIHGTWPEIAAGNLVGRESDDEIIVYAGLGIWGEYASILGQVYKNAIEKGIGTTLKSEQLG